MKSWLPTVRKAFVAAGAAALLALGTALTDGRVTGEEWGWVAGCALAGLLTWAVPNAKTDVAK